MVRGSLVFAAVVMLALAGVASGQADDSDTISEIMEAAVRRRKALSRLEVKIEIERTYPDSPRERDDLEGTLILDGAKRRYEFTLTNPVTRQTERRTWTYDGSVGRAYVANYEQGTIDTSRHVHTWLMGETLPHKLSSLVFNSRPVNSTVLSEGQVFQTQWRSYPRSPFNFSGETAVRSEETIDSHRCVVIDYTNMPGTLSDPSQGDTYRFWFARDLDLSLVRMEYYVPDGDGMRLCSKYELSGFEELSPGAYAPTQARYEDRYSPDLPVSITNLRCRYSTSPVIDESTFTLQFPLGTRVDDEIAGIVYNTPDPIALDEISLDNFNVEELLDEAPPASTPDETPVEAPLDAPAVTAEVETDVDAPPAKPSGPMRFVLPVALIALIVLVIVIVRRR